VLEKDTYYWRVLAVDDNNLITPSTGFRMFGLITSVEHDLNNTTIPRDFTVNQNYPNPFNNQTVVRYSLPYVSGVSFKIYSVSGQLIYSEKHSAMNPGFYIFRWNGISQSGIQVSSGTYFLVIFTDRDMKSQKILLIK